MSDTMMRLVIKRYMRQILSDHQLDYRSAQSVVRRSLASDPHNLLKTNPFYDKYSKKLTKQLIDNKINGKNVQIMVNMNNETSIKTLADNSSPDSELMDQMIANNARDNSGLPPHKRLDDILKLDLLADKSPKEIADIWNSYHQNKCCLYGVVDQQTYERMYLMAQKYKTFTFAIDSSGSNGQSTSSSGQAYDMILSQYDGYNCYMTPLSAYHDHSDRANVCLSIHHFTELLPNKQIVLMYGQYDSQILTASQAKCLANQLHGYYSSPSEDNSVFGQLLQQFHCQPDVFDYNLVIQLLPTFSDKNNQKN
ncbi:ATP synthase mitochondrial F1 complex assembly factor 1-like [Oppia nitens]|uniref:ATP synthase mitochondrial F1 complex assembly factor 1-like n=1 Tax=Oppia nitens TaxID=1686743 RepID=UPI0023DA8757|nr:ATP synthase mitochondrial F1 complex assembly factor 1-like [Oppia nitens]